MRNTRYLWFINNALLILGLLLLCSCQSEKPTPELAAGGQEPPSFEMGSAAFSPGGDIPRQYTCDGDDLSPPLEWAAPPQGTQSLVLIVDDPDAPGKTWVHWVLYDLPPELQALPQALPPQETLPEIGTQGRNDFVPVQGGFGKIGYGGPCPPKGKPHRYFFQLYALDARLDLAPGANKSQVLQAMAGHVLAQAELMGRYER
jgi:Raf kinase inhibitor-like YbhB/YbcL family protein